MSRRRPPATDAQECRALGCRQACVKGQPFCRRCRARLPSDLKDLDRLGDAVTYLGQADGYLTAHVTRSRIYEADSSADRDWV